MSKKDIPGARHLSSKAKKLWAEGTTEDNLPHFRGACYNLVHTYCFFMCRETTCEGCKVADVRSWLSSLKAIPQAGEGTPVVKEFIGLEEEESNAPVYEVDSYDADSEEN